MEIGIEVGYDLLFQCIVQNLSHCSRTSIHYSQTFRDRKKVLCGFTNKNLFDVWQALGLH